MSVWEERAGRNEALFREVNEQLEAVGEEYRAAKQTGTFVCECADAACTTRITVPTSVYEQARAHPRQFLLAEGHDDAAFEHVVARGPDYVIVEKERAAGRIAERTDPRGPTQ